MLAKRRPLFHLMNRNEAQCQAQMKAGLRVTEEQGSNGNGNEQGTKQGSFPIKITQYIQLLQTSFCTPRPPQLARDKDYLASR